MQNINVRYLYATHHPFATSSFSLRSIRISICIHKSSFHWKTLTEMKRLALRDGMRVAYQEWGNQSTGGAAKKVLAVHGWLDNSNTFRVLGPQLASIGYHCVAIDNIGHGKSTHIGSDATYSTPSGVAYINEVLETLGWDKANILGHSMGAGLGMLFAGTFPEKVNKLMLIEGLGPPTSDSEVTAKNLRRSIEAERKFRLKAAQAGGGTNTTKIYPTFADAVDARIKSVSTYPGHQTLSVEAARLLVGRGTYRVDSVTGLPLEEDLEGHPEHRDSEVGDGPVRFRHDPRLVLSTRVYLSNEQVLDLVNGVTAETLLLSAERGWPMEEKSFAYEARIKALTDKGLLTHKHMAGSHHLHIDPETADSVTQEIKKFLLGVENDL